MSSSTPLPAGLNEVAARASRRTIPFDYSFHFDLEGEIGNSHTQAISVSIEAAFTAVSIGYGVIPATDDVQFGIEQLSDFDAPPAAGPSAAAAFGRFAPITLPPPVLAALTSGRTTLTSSFGSAIAAAAGMSKLGNATPLSELEPKSRNALLGTPRQISVGDLLRALARKLGEEQFSALGEVGPRTQLALLNGVRLNPEVAKVFLTNAGNAPLDPTQVAKLFETIGAEPERIQFLYALRDEGTGREFQSEFLLNIAGLGIADGDRPFRYFAVPITFASRSTIRLDVIERSKFKGELFVSLHGYKVLGGTGTPTGRALRARRRRR